MEKWQEKQRRKRGMADGMADVLSFIMMVLVCYGAVRLYKKRREEKYQKWYGGLTPDVKERFNVLKMELTSLNSKVMEKFKDEIKCNRFLAKVYDEIPKDEEIKYFSKGVIPGNTASKKASEQTIQSYIFVTNKRVLVISDVIIKNVLIGKISSISTGGSTNYSWISLNITGSKEMVIGGLGKNNLFNLKNIINQEMENYKNINIQINQTTNKDAADQIARLNALYKDGILTDYEFAIKKMEILDRVKE